MQKKIKLELERIFAKTWPELDSGAVVVEYPPKKEFGDYSSALALQIAGRLKSDPMAIAQKIADNFALADVTKVTLLRPGFINFTVSDSWLERLPQEIQKKENSFSASSQLKGRHVNIEFISANPTGPLTLANGRGGFLGDVLANVLTKMGALVEREYYVNDSGNQVNILAESVLRKYFKQHGIPVDFPEYCYQGTYIDDLAKTLRVPNYNLAKTKMEDIRDKIKDRIVRKMVSDIKSTIKEKMGISFDTFFSEKSLYESEGPIDKTLSMLKEKNLVYEKDDALWLATSKFKDEKDRVLIKKDGEYTYFLPDISYHLDKFERRGFDSVINILGADHHGYVNRMYAAMEMFGHRNQLTLMVMQMVRLMDNGKEIRMSKRKGTYVTIDELIDDVGLDAARYFFLMHAPNTHMDFDLNLAKERSEKNPVYYVQYAHARMCSILKMVEEKGKAFTKETALHHETRELLQELSRWPEILEQTSQDFAAQRLPEFAQRLATSFHVFYTSRRILSSDGSVNQTLLSIVKAAKIVLQDLLSVMGISAPERME